MGFFFSVANVCFDTELEIFNNSSTHAIDHTEETQSLARRTVSRINLFDDFLKCPM